MKTFDIPGGTVSFRDKDELTVAGSRAIALATRKLPRRALEAAEAQPDGAEEGALVDEQEDEETDIVGFPIDLSDEDVEATWAYNDTLVVAYLAEWSLARPLPRSRDDLGLLPSPIYAALNQAIAAHVAPAKAASAVDGFSVDAVEDADSPTGA